MQLVALSSANLIALAALAQSVEPIDALNQALAASENLAVAAAQSPDPALAEVARRAHFDFLQAIAAFRSTPYQNAAPIDPITFEIFVKELGRSDKLTQDRLAMIARSSARHLFTVDQVVTLMDLFPLDREKVQVAAITYEHVLDAENYQKVYEALTFGLSRRTLGLLLAR
jgi:Domain of unknown function (DUF4476)